MKKNISARVLLLLLVVVMSGCSTVNGGATGAENVSSPASVSHEQDVSSPPASDTDESLPEKAEENPLEEAEGSVPDFLDEHQQTLYRQAKTAFMEFTLENSGFGSGGSDDPPFEQDGMHYYRCDGAITKWSDFETAMLSVFTPDYFKELNSRASYTDGDGVYHERTIFAENNGDLCYSGGARGAAMTFVGPETFELISETDEEIQFYVVGTYDDYAEDADGNFIKDASGDFRRAGNPVTEKKLLVMKNGSAGWRFSEFQLAF